MSHTSLDALETTLRQLTEIVERNHSNGDTTSLIKQMAKLVVEMRSKSRTGATFPAGSVVASK
jgi:hypothetical protein